MKIVDFRLIAIHKFENQLHSLDKRMHKFKAPELISSQKYDSKVDIYSLEVIFQIIVLKLKVNFFKNLNALKDCFYLKFSLFRLYDENNNISSSLKLKYQNAIEFFLKNGHLPYIQLET